MSDERLIRVHMTVAERLTAESKERGITARRLASMLLDYALDRLAAGELQPIEKVEPVKEVAKSTRLVLPTTISARS